MDKHTCCSCSSCKHNHCAKKISLFSSLSSEDLEEISKLITRKHYEKGEIIFYEGDVFDKLLIINGGSVKVYEFTKEGKEQIVYILKEGNFLGDLNLLKKGAFPFAGTALESTDLCIIHKNDFDILIKTNPEISLKLLEYAHDRISTLEELIKTLTTKDIDARLATLLLNFSKIFGVKDSSQIEINLPVSREDMANFIGVTRETISRKLSGFQNQGLIDIVENRKITIKDIDKLKELCE